jgi:hypothetical protein
MIFAAVILPATIFPAVMVARMTREKPAEAE